MLCARIEQLLSAQSDLLAVECPAALEREAQRCAAQYLAQHGQAREEPTASQSARAPEVQAVEVDSLTLAFPRSAGVEHVGLWAMRAASGLCPWLSELGLSGPQRAAVVGSVIGRMAAPASERATYQWLCERSGLGEARGRGLRGDARDQAVSGLRPTAKAPEPHRAAPVLARRSDLFGLSSTVTLYDLTNTYFEGEVANNPKAKRGHSKEKREPTVRLADVGASARWQRLCAASRSICGQRDGERYAGRNAQGA